MQPVNLVSVNWVIRLFPIHIVLGEVYFLSGVKILMTTEFFSGNPNENNQYKMILARAAALAESNLFSQHLVYEKNGECWFAGGVKRSVTLFANRLEFDSPEGKVIKHLNNSRELCQALEQELKSWRGQWQACGWACFELAYALKCPELLNADESEGREALLFICEPEVSVYLNSEDTHVKTDDPVLQQQVCKTLDEAEFKQTAGVSGVEIPEDNSYKHAVSQSLTKIHNSGLDKVILSRKVPLDFTPDFTATWLKGRLHNTPARSFTMDLAGWKASGFSPEIVLSVNKEREVTAEPLAGTKRMEGNAEQDINIFNELFKDSKEIHEHAISVKLAVEEMEAVCEAESVVVRKFMGRKQRGSVQHLSSRVSGQLKPEHNLWHAFESLFPAVTASGIQKQAAFAEIRRHESGSRGIYAGAVLRLDHSGELDSALVLRSIMGKGDQAWLQAGAGVVLDSTPEREFTETVEKLSSISPWVVAKSA